VSDPLALIVGLGNPGAQYQHTRHNAGTDFVLRVAQLYGGTFKAEPKFKAQIAKIAIAGRELRLLIPETFMNLSGQSVGPAAQFFKLEPSAILIAHDELDLPPGEARFKHDGGHGGHNGLRDIIPSLGNRRDFYRLRIGIGHPGAAPMVSGFVLSRAPLSERQKIDACIEEAVANLPDAVSGDWPRAMKGLNSFRA